MDGEPIGPSRPDTRLSFSLVDDDTPTASTSDIGARPKLNSTNSFQVEMEELSNSNLQSIAKRGRPLWYTQMNTSLATNFPLVSRALTYLRGPRPKVDMSDPKPFLNINLTTKRGTIILPLESALVHVTRPFTARWMMALFVVAYILALSFFARAQAYQTPESAFIDCTSTYWTALNGCGLNGELCAPFNQSSFDFRCPAQCKAVVLANPRTIGIEAVDNVPLIIGGGDSNRTYRGDSFICAAAVQAGMFSDTVGGCATVTLIGTFTDFLPFDANGLSSIGFPSLFPLSYRFSLSSVLTEHCSDLRNEALAFNILMTAILFLVLRPRPPVIFWCLVCIGYWHVTLFSQPRAQPPPLDEAFGTFLPTLFVSYAFWRLAFRFVLPAFYRAGAPIESAIWYLGPYWIGVLTNVVFEKIPINRLDSANIEGQRGAVTALVIICAIIFVIFVNQMRVIRKTGWLPWYAGCYILGGFVTMVLALLPGLELRLHHYVLAMVLIPGTAFPTRLSAVYQGLLLGMFLNGVAAFDFASILQTTADLVRDAPLGTSLPVFSTNSSTYNSTIPIVNQTLTWQPFPYNQSWDGFSLLIDDVERYVGPALNFSLNALETGIPHFFRLAFSSQGTSGDYTEAATLWPNGTWVNPQAGPS